MRIPKPRRVLALLSDDKLVEQVRRGDAVAFEVLYDRHNAGVFAFCRHMLGTTHDAEDAVQHVFMAAHADLQRGARRRLHFKAWIYTIARNRCLSVLRSRREHPAENVEVAVDRIGDQVAQRAELRALLADVGKLPEDQREALVLSELGDLSHAEVAEVLGCEAAKVKSLVFQARTALIARRRARDTSCEEIREQLATLRGGALRRSHLRHHLEACPGCSEYRDQVRHQRQLLAAALPVLPAAGLRDQVMAALGLGGGTAVAGGGAGLVGAFGVAAKSAATKVSVALVIAGGAAGTAAVVEHKALPSIPLPTVLPHSQPHQGASPAPSASPTPSAAPTSARPAAPAAGHRTQDHGRGAGGGHGKAHREHGATPAARANERAAVHEKASQRAGGGASGHAKAHQKKAAAGHPAKTRSHRQRTTAKTHKVRSAPIAKTEAPPTQKTTDAPAPAAEVQVLEPAPVAPNPGQGSAKRGVKNAAPVTAG